MQGSVGPTRLRQTDSGKIDATNQTGNIREPSLPEALPCAFGGCFGGGESSDVLTPRVFLVQTATPREVSRGGIPGGFIPFLDGSGQSDRHVVVTPFSGQEQPLRRVTRVGESWFGVSETGFGRGYEIDATRIFGCLRGQVDGRVEADARRKSVVDVEERVVVERDRFRVLFAVEAEVIAAGELPPLIEHGVMAGAVAEIVELQTEARRRQSIRPHLGVFAMTSLRTSSPLVGEVFGDP
jgi:hypothetical protein